MNKISVGLLGFGIIAIILDKYIIKKDSKGYRIIITSVFVICFLGSYFSQYFSSRD